MTHEEKEKRRIVKRIAQLDGIEFDAVVYYLLGDERERELAMKILNDTQLRPVYGTGKSVS